MAWQDDICERCFTTHPLNEAGERVCPKPPMQETDISRYGTAVIWNTTGSTCGFSGGGRIPRTDFVNAGHQEPTLGSLGLSSEDGAALGI